MKTVLRYTRIFLCLFVMVVVIIAPASTGSSPAASISVSPNTIDATGLMSQWDQSLVEAAQADEPFAAKSIQHDIWDFGDSKAGNEDVTLANFADELDQDTGYNKLTDMAQNGYADLSAGQTKGQSLAANTDLQARATPMQWGSDSSPAYRDDGSSSTSNGNAYTTPPAPLLPVSDPGATEGDDGGASTDPGSTVVPLPAAAMLAGIGVATVNWLRRRKIL
jgi:hypothetical protein